MTKRSWLDILEYLSVAGSVAGSVAAVATQQIVYAATPLSLSVVLNLTNRRRLAQQKLAAENLSDLNEQLSRQIAALHEQVRGLPTDSEFNSMQVAVSKHSEDLGEVQRQLEKTLSSAGGIDIAPLRQDISVLREHYGKLQEAIAGVSDRLNSVETQKTGATAPGVDRLESAIAQINSKIAQFQNKLSKLDSAKLDSASPSSTDLTPVLSEISQLAQRIEGVRESAADALEGEIQGLRARLEQMASQNPNGGSAPQQWDALTSAIAQLQQRQQELERAVTPVSQLQHQLEQLSQTVAQQPDIEQVQRLRTALSVAIALIPELEQRLELESHDKSSTLDLTGVESSLNKIAESVAEAIAEINTRIAPLESVNLHHLQEDLSTHTAELERLTAGLATLQAEHGSWQASLASLSEKIDRLPAGISPTAIAGVETALSSLQERVDRLSALPYPELQQRVEQIAERVNGLPEAIASQADVEQLNTALSDVTQNLSELSQFTDSLDSLNMLRDRLDDLDRRISNLNENLTETLTADRQQLTSEVETLREQLEWQVSGVPTAVNTEVNHQIHQLLEQFNARPELEQIESLRQSVSELAQRLDGMSGVVQAGDPAGDGEAIAALRQDVSNLQAALDRVRESVDNLSPLTPERMDDLERELAQLESQVRNAGDRSAQLSVQPQIEQLTQQLKAMANASQSSAIGYDDANVQASIAAAIAHQLQQIEQLLAGINAHQYELIFDRPAIRTQLEEAIDTAQTRLVLVCPWVSRASLDGNLLQKIEGLLQRGVQVELGWGHLRDIDSGEFPIRINENWQLDPMTKRNLYDALNDLEHLKQQYGDRLRLKVLGTHENFLVCDESWAMLATHHFLSTNDGVPEREVGLRTSDPKIVRGLIDRFSEPTLNPANATAYYNRGFERLDIGDYQGAVEDYTCALEIDSNQPTAYNNRGLAKFHLGDYPGAISDYSRSLELNPNEAVVYFNRGFARFNGGDYSGAVEDYTEAIALAPEQTGAYFYRGETYGHLGDYQKAQEDYTCALQLNPQDPVAYNNRGLARYNQADYVGAIGDYSEALRIKPDDAVAFLNRGVARSAGGDYHGAIEDFTQALSLNEKYASAYNYRGRARAEVGDRQGAIADLQTAADLFSRQGDPANHQQAIDALTKLASGE